MPIDKLHSASNYVTERNTFIAIRENARLFNNGTDGGIHFPKGFPTIGYGYDLTRHPPDEITTYLTHALGGQQALTPDQVAGLDIISQWKNGVFTTQQFTQMVAGPLRN